MKINVQVVKHAQNMSPMGIEVKSDIRGGGRLNAFKSKVINIINLYKFIKTVR